MLIVPVEILPHYKYKFREIDITYYKSEKYAKMVEHFLEF